MLADHPRVIIESPFGGDDKWKRWMNLGYACEALRDSINRGEAPFASHLLYPQVLADDVPADRAVGIRLGLAWAKDADYVVFYLDRGWSAGMEAALVVHEAAGRRIIERRIK